MRGPAAVLSLLLIALAGCVDEATPTEGGGGEDGPMAATPGAPDVVGPDALAAPTWVPGDHWTWDVIPLDHVPYSATTVVASVTDDAYSIGWSEIETGLRSQFFHFIPHGTVDRADLVGEAHHEPVAWLDFPLEDGKTWNGSLWLADLAFRADAAEVTGPNGTSDGFAVRGSDESGGVRVEIDWSRDLGIFTGLRFYLHGDEPWLELRLTALGSGWTGPVHLLESDLAFATFTSFGSTMAGRVPPLAAPLAIPAGVTHVAIGCYAGGAPGYYAYSLTGADATRYGCEREVSTETDAPLLLDWGAVSAGTWLSRFTTVGQGSIFTELFLVQAETLTVAG